MTKVWKSAPIDKKYLALSLINALHYINNNVIRVGRGGEDTMQANVRRENILNRLHQAKEPVSAGTLAADFSVSRQVIVGDIALLRASGADISATPRGYVIRRDVTGVIHKVACRHDSVGMESELNAIVDHGCTVLDVIVEHPIYGQLTGPLALSSRYDVSQFIRRSAETRPLSLLTEGIHLHTISCPDEDSFVRCVEELRKLGVLLEE